jgi:hypothetical protein
MLPEAFASWIHRLSASKGVLGACVLAITGGCGGGGGSSDWLFPLWVPTSVVVRDIDGNGLPDVITTAQLGISMGVSEGRVKVHRQTSAGVYAPPDEYTVGTTPWDIKVADINGDGRLDLVVAEPASGSGTTPGGVWQMLHDPANLGHYLPPVKLIAGPSVYSLDVADLTGDGVVDIVLGDSRSSANYLIVLAQDAAHRGTFLTPAYIPLPGPASRVVAKDLSADGLADLTTSFISAQRPDYSYDTSVGVMLQSAGSFGSLTAVTNFAYGSTGYLLNDDFNADGRPDIAVYFNRFNELAIPTIRLIVQGSAGTWNPAIDTLVPVDSIKGRDGQTAADVNGDGHPDLVFVGTYPEGTTSDGFSIIKSSMTLLVQDGSGHFVQSTAYTPPFNASRIGAGDLNGDGRIDLVLYGSFPASTGNRDAVLVYLQSSVTVGVFQPPVEIR